MTVSRREVEKMKAELDKHERKLLKHENKWNVASVVQRLSSHDQSRLLKASVAARTLTVSIPKLKYKIDDWLTKRDDRLLQDFLADYEVIDNKARWAYEEFKTLESGKEKASRTSKNDRDKALSLSIEQSLRQRRESKSTISKPGSSSGREAKVSASTRETSKTGCVAGRSGEKPMTARSIKEKRVKEQLKGGGDVKEGYLNETGGLLSDADEETKKFLEQLQGTVAPEDLTWLMQSKQSLAATRGMEDLEKIQDHKDRKTLRKQIEEKVRKGIEYQQEKVKASTREEKPFSFRPKLPSPVPIDTFLNFVESLPGEIRHMVKEQTDTLCALQEEQIFSKNQLSDRKGRLVSMDKLRDEYRDDRFDASDFKMRVPDSLIDEEHLKWIKEQKVDDAIERYFGSFKKREPPKLKGDFLDAILEPDFMQRVPIRDPITPEPQEDPEELLEKYHLQRVNLLRNQDFKDTE